MAVPIGANPSVLSQAAAESQSAEIKCPHQETPKSMEVVDQLSRMAFAHQSKWYEVKWDIFSEIIKKFSSQRDTLEERCFMLGLSILACQDLPYRLHCLNLNVIFLQECAALGEQNPGIFSSLENYNGLLEKEAWDQLFNAMGIPVADVLVEEWLGPIRPTVFNQLLSEPSVAGAALRTLLPLGNTLTIRIRSEEDFESWEKLCTLAKRESLKRSISQAAVVPFLLLKPPKPQLDREKHTGLDLPKIISQVREIEIAGELLPSFVSDTEKREDSMLQATMYHRALVEVSRRIHRNAKVCIGFSPYPGCPMYPNR